MSSYELLPEAVSVKCTLEPNHGCARLRVEQPKRTTRAVKSGGGPLLSLALGMSRSKLRALAANTFRPNAWKADKCPKQMTPRQLPSYRLWSVFISIADLGIFAVRDRAAPMSNRYRLYFIEPLGVHFESLREFEAPNEGLAIVLSEDARGSPGMELWCGNRRIKRWPPEAATLSSRGLER